MWGRNGMTCVTSETRGREAWVEGWQAQTTEVSLGLKEPRLHPR